jgi:hypothetical protein
MKTLYPVILVLSMALWSCSVTKKAQNPEWTEEEKTRAQMVDYQPIPLRSDSSKTIIVYNVVEKEDPKKLKISDETVRMFIADLFGTLTTIITLRQIDSNETP